MHSRHVLTKAVARFGILRNTYFPVSAKYSLLLISFQRTRFHISGKEHKPEADESYRSMIEFFTISI